MNWTDYLILAVYATLFIWCSRHTKSRWKNITTVFIGITACHMCLGIPAIGFTLIVLHGSNVAKLALGIILLVVAWKILIKTIQTFDVLIEGA